jgi:tRNA G18 (ribose-2'-O)-methylase SpoU
MGTVFQVPWTRIDNWPASQELVRRLGFTTLVFGLRDDARALNEFAGSAPERVALIFGTEGAGLRPRTLDSADSVVRIPMREGVDSLNVASATGIALWAISQAIRRS